MAVDVYSENFVGMISPRLSFSRDLEDIESSINPINDFLDLSLVDSAFEFAFNVDTSITFPSSSADELFSGGKILPTSIQKEEIKNNEVLQEKAVTPCLDPLAATLTEVRKKSLKEFLEDSIEEEDEDEDSNNATAAKSFWKFRRSNSLNCDRDQRKGLIGSWKILSRSGSTGKFLEKIVEEGKPNNSYHSKLLRKFTRNNSLNSENITCNVSNNVLPGSSKILRRSHSTSDHYLAKSDLETFRRSNSTGSALVGNGNKLKKQYCLKQQQNQFVENSKSIPKGKVKHNCRGYGYGNHCNNNLRISPVLNLPSSYISKVSVDLFSFGSLFCNGTTAKHRKRKNDTPI
ncbi:uncharacterized protein LOC104896445 [Beta vulgaris subsp. vulgaris]|uniref:uncharacterized protein LOC104896445 n=1 Tax=Beta vulgaris subsp. vulgaris TaxID=3555 RepID=UPI0020367819|nr:uncharacterized protein LOC104896445 [Beta vulgaris subsp. vulgaris]